MYDRQELKKHISSFAEQHNEIIAVYLFGSTATGKNTDKSDVDISLMANSTIHGLTRITWETALSIAIGRNVDLVIFNQAGVLLRHQILKYGECIFEKYTNARIEQGMKARTEYLDTRFLYKKLAI